MNSYECYVTYLALKNHFTSNQYDYFKYLGKVNASPDSLRARKDRFFFEKLAKHNDPFGFLLANLISNPHSYVRDLAYNEEAKNIYIKWLKTKESLSYHVTEQLKALDDDLKSTLVTISAQHPKIIREYLGKRISLETLCVIVDITKCIPYWEKQQLNDPVFNDVVWLVKKYTPFIKYDKEKFTDLIKQKATGKE